MPGSLGSMLSAFAMVAAHPGSEEVAGWSISRDENTCSMMAAYERNVSVFVSYLSRRNDARIYILDPAFRSIKRHDKHKLDVFFHSHRKIIAEYETTTFTGVELEEGDKGITALFEGREFLEDFGRADKMLVMRDDVVVAAIDLSGTAAAVAALRRCAIAAEKANPSDPFDGAKPANLPYRGFGASKVMPRGAVGNWITMDDYPSDARAARQEGTVEFRLAIDATGRVERCEVTRSSGSTALDETTCRLLQRRALFYPATDDAGEPVAASYVNRFSWALPVQ